MIWVAGIDAGIYALGTVVSEPIVRSDAPEATPYWRAPSSGNQPRPRVLVHFDQVFADAPLRKTFLMTDPVLQQLGVITCPRATNFSVTEAQWHALQEWLPM